MYISPVPVHVPSFRPPSPRVTDTKCVTYRFILCRVSQGDLCTRESFCVYKLYYELYIYSIICYMIYLLRKG